jgi:RNA polymerase sigma-70 factor (ECF subfamily)
MQEPTDRDLIDRFRDGDGEALRLLFERYEDLLQARIRRRLPAHLRRKVSAAVHRHGGIAKRAAGREVSGHLRPETAQLVGHVPSPSQVAIAAELKELARRAMDALPKDYREVLRLAREEQLPLREVAARMGRTREAVKKLHGRALFRFTEVFEQLRGGEHA